MRTGVSRPSRAFTDKYACPVGVRAAAPSVGNRFSSRAHLWLGNKSQVDRSRSSPLYLTSMLVLFKNIGVAISTSPQQPQIATNPTLGGQIAVKINHIKMESKCLQSINTHSILGRRNTTIPFSDDVAEIPPQLSKCLQISLSSRSWK